MPGIAELLAEGQAALAAVGNMQPRREARLLLAGALGVDPGRLLTIDDETVPLAVAAAFRAMLARRARHEPVARILGRREFWSLEFRIGPAVLDPRPDTETLVDAVLATLADRRKDPLRVLDLGTGSGCILLALLHELPAAEGVGVDVSEAALAIARENAATLGLSTRSRFRKGDWFAGTEGSFDVIVSNPPYIPSREIGRLMPDVALYDPHTALDGGADGLRCYRVMAGEAARFLRPAGFLAVEVGAGQASDVKAIFTRAGFTGWTAGRDLAGIERALIFRPGAK
ncbi:MAG: peptide chain release factor N(5)-glutamine methyltransferase [Alphaproteobacteria bacterium]|nr:peptide chain release factor N(5)-glutamine methyltransferase [Alphaproteobacteria bacterium]